MPVNIPQSKSILFSFPYFRIPAYLCHPENPGHSWDGLKRYQRRYIKLMLIIDSKDCENIDKALKKYKKKFEKSKVLLQLRERQSFTKPSVRRRGQVLKAIYKQKIASGKIEG
jgi:small subunit ribosomal protein S21